MRVFPIVLGVAGIGFGYVLYRALRIGRSSGLVIQTPEAPMSPVPAVKLPVSPFQPFTNQMLASAKKWGNLYGVPVQQILATIMVESNAKVGAKSNNPTMEDSRGLMQINIRSEMPRLQKMGITVDQLYDVDTNIHVGTSILKEYGDRVKALMQDPRAKPQMLSFDEILRLYYKGPALVKSDLLSGRQVSYKDSDKAITRWRNAMAQVKPAAQSVA